MSKFGKVTQLGILVGAGLLLAVSVLARRGPDLPPVGKTSGKPRTRAPSVAAAVATDPLGTMKDIQEAGADESSIAPCFREDKGGAMGVPASGRKDEALWSKIYGFLEGIQGPMDRDFQRTWIIAMTATQLGLQGENRKEFEQTAVDVARAISMAWQERERDLLSIPVTEEHRATREAEIQERYEDAKLKAMSRLEPLLLGKGPHAEQLQEHLEEWIDVIR